MSKFNKKFVWMFGSKANWLGYKRTGVSGMYCTQVVHHWFGIYGLIGFRYSITWGSNL